MDTFLICWLYWKEETYLKLLVFHWLRKIALNYISISKVSDTAFGTVLIPERWMFLFMRTEHTVFKVFLPNPILYSYLIWLVIMPGIIWKHLSLIVKINCASSTPAFQLLRSSATWVGSCIHMLSASPLYLPTPMLSLQC